MSNINQIIFEAINKYDRTTPFDKWRTRNGFGDRGGSGLHEPNLPQNSVSMAREAVKNHASLLHNNLPKALKHFAKGNMWALDKSAENSKRSYNNYNIANYKKD